MPDTRVINHAKNGCPFCGSRALMIVHEMYSIHVFCRNCHCRGPVSVIKYPTGGRNRDEADDNAVRLWDERKPEAK